ncbi:MAG: hypothetical protein KatS3mg103_1182 [Phycisphaerales bacterium]|nr:MAG: hypothetical protein KatS3mg103_1182 [Phycisphaerales bacterium]
MPAHDQLTTFLLAVHAAATWFMVGLIWFVQLVHYPLFTHVHGEAWRAYHRRHTARTTLVVGVAMPVELFATVWLVSLQPGAASLAGAVLLAIAWACTFFVQVPLHARLAGLDDPHTRMRLIEMLVRTNWVRTAAWSVRGGLALWMLSPA